ncbi:LacI family DNA-binding transcriptional regulator [Paenibacillus sp. BR2-3]|uniref:LacI family DNA-binding transcriptional regulator n=1 Tax=Paenibacillus sp. BR2-3 TaxID=3048494 RepID=UPI003977766F
MDITIKDVAMKAKVSIATVSRVLNQSKPVSQAIKQRVLEVVEELEYNPNPVARSLIMKESKLIGLLIPAIENTYISIFVGAIEEELFKNNYTTLLCNTKRDLDIELHYLKLLKEKYVDGVVLLTSSPKPQQIEFFENHAVPVIFASHTDTEGRFASINIDEFQAAYDATKFLLESGHRKIAFFGGPLAYYQIVQRLEGYKQALKEYGIEYDDKLFYEQDYDIESGYRSGMKLFNNDELPTAIFCVSDMVAIGAIRAAEDSGLRVPEDISVMGFDDIPIAGAYRPALTTVRQPVYELGVQAAQMLLRQIQDKENYVKEARIVPHEIIERGSCRKVTNNTQGGKL